MFSRSALLTAVATVSLGFASTAMAQFDDTPFNHIPPSAENNQRGGGFKPPDPRPYPGAPIRKYNTNPSTSEGSKTAEYQAEQRDLASASNSINTTFPQYDTREPTWVERDAIVARSYVEPDPLLTVKPDDFPVVPPVSPDLNARRDANYDPTYDSMYDPSKDPLDPTMDITGSRYSSGDRQPDWDAQPASSRMPPDAPLPPVVMPPPAPPVTPPPVTPREYQSTWASQSDRQAQDDNVRRPLRTPDKDQPAPMKGERAPGALDNTRNPVPDKTIFGKVGDIRSNGPVNNAGEPLPRPTPPPAPVVQPSTVQPVTPIEPTPQEMPE